jgi:hypothetical protein
MLDVTAYPLLPILVALWALVAAVVLMREGYASERAAWLGYAYLAFVTAHGTYLMVLGEGLLSVLQLAPVLVLASLALAGVVFIRQRERSADEDPKMGIIAVFAALALTYAGVAWFMHVWD